MRYDVEAWTYCCDDDGPLEAEMVANEMFDTILEAMSWAWDRMAEGYSVCLHTRRH